MIHRLMIIVFMICLFACGDKKQEGRVEKVPDVEETEPNNKLSEAIPVSDGTLQMDLDLADPSVREKVIADYRSEQVDMTRFLRRFSAPLLMISNQGDVVAQVRRLLGVPGRAS